MPYTAEKPRLTPSVEELRQRIPGWGVDLDPADRPGVPKERFDPGSTGAHWDFPERQEERWPRERSIEHKFLTPVFGTSTPPSGLSGVLRRYAYRYSEATTSHWVLLVLADRVNAVEAAVGSALRGQPDNPLTETGVVAEFTRHGIQSRVGRNRADLKHQPLDILIVAAPWLLAGYVGFAAARALGRPRSDPER